MVLGTIFSTFEYETHNCTVKNFLHGNVMPLTQVTNRIEYNTEKHDFLTEKRNIEVKDRQKDGSFSQLKYYDLTFKINCVGQNYALLKSGEGIKLTRIFFNTSTNKIVLTGKPLKHRSSVYNQVDTMRFNIFKSTNEFGDKMKFTIDELMGKCGNSTWTIRICLLIIAFILKMDNLSAVITVRCNLLMK